MFRALLLSSALRTFLTGTGVPKSVTANASVATRCPGFTGLGLQQFTRLRAPLIPECAQYLCLDPCYFLKDFTVRSDLLPESFLESIPLRPGCRGGVLHVDLVSAGSWHKNGSW